MAFTKIDKTDYNGKGVIGLPDAPQLSTTAMQEKFEELSIDVIIPKHNALIDELEAVTGASNIGSTNGTVQSELDSYNAKISGYNGDISQLKADMSQAKADIVTLQNDDATAQSDIATLKTDNTANKAQIATNKSDIATLKTTTASNTSRVTALETDNTKNKADITSIKGDVAVLNSQKHTHSNKSVIDALSKDAATGNLMFENKPIQGGGGNADAYGHVKVGSVTLNAKGDDTLELIAGSNITLTPNATNKTVVINSSGGGGGTSTGDMLKSDYVLPGGTGQVLSAKDADHAVNADNATNAVNATNAANATTAVSATTATTANQVGSAITSVLEGLSDVGGKLYYGSSPVDTQFDIDNAIDDVTIKKNASGKIEVASAITTKLSKLDTDTSAVDDEVLAWDSAKGQYTPKVAKGGHDMYKSVADMPKDAEGYIDISSTDEHVMSAFAIQEIANTKTYEISYEAKISDGNNNGIGTWYEDDIDTNPWTLSDTADWIGAKAGEQEISDLIKQLNPKNPEIRLLFETERGEKVYDGGFCVDTDTGRLCIKFGNEITRDALIYIQLTVITKMN